MYRCWSFVKTLSIATLLLLHIFLIHTTRLAADQVNDEQIELLWAFGAIVGTDQDQRLISINDDMVLRTGDRIKFFINPKNNCFIYLFHHSAQNKLALLFPSDISAAHIPAGTRHFIPSGNAWFTLDAITGFEKFFLVISRKKLDELESLYQKKAVSDNDPDIDASKQPILAEINKLQRQHRTLTASAERPMRLGGNFRGAHDDDKDTLPDISQIAVEITAVKFYSRTFTIDHR
jgi:hypothetical protein